jgi:hypothetical protein
MQRDPRRWQTPFGRHIARRGVPWVVGRLEAEGIGVIPQTVYPWVAAIKSPRPSPARTLVRTSGGALTWNDIYGHREQLARHVDRAEGATCRSA